MPISLARFFLAAAAAINAARCRHLAALTLVFCATTAGAQITGIRPDVLPDAILGDHYSVTFTPINPFNGLPVNWNISEGCFGGSGLTFSPLGVASNTAQLKGAAAMRGTFSCVITATDAGDNSFSQFYSLQVVKECPRPQITSLPPTAVLAGVPYTFTVTAGGGGVLRFSALGLPAGLTINPITGVITGTTFASGSHQVTIIVAGCGRSALQDFSLVVSPAAVVLSLSNQPNPAIFGQAIAVAVHANGGSVVPTGNVLLCVIAPGQYCAPPVGVPPPGTASSLVPPLLSAPLDSNGDAALTLTGLPIQNYVLQAYYGGDPEHGQAGAGPVDQFVIKGTVFPPRVATVKDGVTAAAIPTLSRTTLALLALALAAIVAAQLRRRTRGG